MIISSLSFGPAQADDETSAGELAGVPAPDQLAPRSNRRRSWDEEGVVHTVYLYRNPAYMELFNMVYDKYFLFFARTMEGNVIFDDISRYKSLTSLSKPWLTITF